MMEGLTIMLVVFITLIYIYTMPNKHYCSKPTSLRCHLMAKRCLKVDKKNRDLRQETCQHGAVTLPESGQKMEIRGKKPANMVL